MNELTRTSPRKEIQGELYSISDKIQKQLPAHISVDRFNGVVLTALGQNPELLMADRRSFFNAVMRAANDGLIPDGREGALVIFNAKDKRTNKWEKHVQWMPMVAGILKKAMQAGEVLSITSHTVYQEDHFIWRQGDDESIEHSRAPLGQKRGDLIGVYAIAKLKNGTILREVLDLDEIEKIKGASKTGSYGPWKDWFEEMCKKSAIRRLAKRLPMSPGLESVILDQSTEADFSKGTDRITSQPLTRQALINGSNAPEHHDNGEIEDNATKQGHSGDDEQPEQEPEPEQTSTQEQDDAGPPSYQPLIDKITSDIQRAENVGAILNIEREFAKHREALPDDVVAGVDKQIADAKARFKKGASA